MKFDLNLAYTVDLLARMTESIETYLDDDRLSLIHISEPTRPY